MLTALPSAHMTMIYLAQALPALAAVLLLLPAALYLWFRRSLPQINGSQKVAGISSPVEIIRDTAGVPHIYAASPPEAWFGLGYAHAQDRLWQMDFQRRIGRGRVAEVLGQRGVAFDRLARTIGFARIAAQTWDQLDLSTREVLASYASGVNAFLARCPASRLPPEFAILRVRPEPWTGADSVLLGLLLAWTLGGNYPSELLRQRLYEAVGEARCGELIPGYFGGHHPVPAHPGSTLKDIPELESLGRFSEGSGSNLWAVGPEKTETGGAVLANDPHLPSTNPMTWYLAHVCAPGLEAIGATTPGVPAILLGRNRAIAWGMTNLNPDVQDFYLERLDDSGRLAEFRGVFERMHFMDESIRVRGSHDVKLRVDITRHGPLAAGIMGIEKGEPLAFRWTGLDPTNASITAFLRLNEACDWESFRSAVRLCTSVPVNFGYADVRGNIGFHASGSIPIRENHDGSMPAVGWTGENEWTGFIPFDELPHSFNPPDQYLVLINTAPPDPEYPYLLTTDWVEPYRRERMHTFLRARNRMTAEDHATLQADTFSRFALRALPTLLPLVEAAADRIQGAVDMLKHWDGDARGSSASAAIFSAWMLELPRVLLANELSKELMASYEGWPSWVFRFTLDALEGRVTVTCDRELAARTSLEKALSTLRRALGSDMQKWRWDRVHRAVFPHSPLNTKPWLRRFFSRSIPIGGDWSTVNLGGIVTSAPFDQRNIAGYRQIVDMSQPGGRFIHAGKQCGHFLARRFDYMSAWANTVYVPMRMERGDIDRHTAGVVRLEPDKR